MTIFGDKKSKDNSDHLLEWLIIFLAVVFVLSGLVLIVQWWRRRTKRQKEEEGSIPGNYGAERPVSDAVRENAFFLGGESHVAYL